MLILETSKGSLRVVFKGNWIQCNLYEGLKEHIEQKAVNELRDRRAWQKSDIRMNNKHQNCRKCHMKAPYCRSSNIYTQYNQYNSIYGFIMKLHSYIA